MKKSPAISIAAMAAFLMFGAGAALSEMPADQGRDNPILSADERELEGQDHGAGVECPPVGQGGSAESDDAVGNESPLTRQESDDQTASAEPCPPEEKDQSAQSGDATDPESSDKGAGSPEAIPDDSAGPDNNVK